MSMASEYAAEYSMVLVVTGAGCRAPEARFLGGLACILLPLVHLLQELLRFLLIHKRQSSEALFQLKSVEEDAILAVPPILENLLIPYYSSVPGLSLCQQWCIQRI
jgi:hypothetical protein